MNAHDDAQRRLAELVFGGLADGAERDALEAHLAECAACRAECDLLAGVLPVLDVPETAVPETSGDISASPVPTSLPSPTAPVPAVSPLGVSPPAAPARAVRTPRGPRVAAVAVTGAAVGALALAAVVLDRPARSWHHAPLEAHGSALTGTVRFDDVATGIVVDLDLAGVAHLDEQARYEAWFSSDGTHASIGSFVPASDGSVAVMLHGTGDLDDYDQFVITAEPDPHDPARNGPVIATARLDTEPPMTSPVVAMSTGASWRRT